MMNPAISGVSGSAVISVTDLTLSHEGLWYCTVFAALEVDEYLDCRRTVCALTQAEYPEKWSWEMVGRDDL